MSSSRTPFHLLIAILTIVSVGLATTTAGAAKNAAWSDTMSREDVLVKECQRLSTGSGHAPTLGYTFDFTIKTSYTSKRTFHQFELRDDTADLAIAQRYESFVGATAASSTGLALPYSGHYSRVATDGQGEVMITDLVLNLLPAGGEAITVKVDRARSPAIDSPEAVLLAYAPRGLHMSLCSYFTSLELAG
jgi:hypothetical protein